MAEPAGDFLFTMDAISEATALGNELRRSLLALAEREARLDGRSQVDVADLRKVLDRAFARVKSVAELTLAPADEWTRG